MKVDIKATNIDLTSTIKDYAEKKVESLEKFILNPVDPSIQAWIEVGKTTMHHQTGDIFRAEIQIQLPHIEKIVYTESKKDDLYAAIDEAQEEMKRELCKIKGKKISLIRRGGRLLKKFIPFVDK